MTEHDATPPGRNMVGIAFAYAIALCAVWGGAWLLSWRLEAAGILPDHSFSTFAYWLLMRVLFWLLPSLALIRRTGRRVRDVLGFHRVKSILLWGGITGLVWGGKAPLFRLLAGQPVHPIVWDWSFVTAVIYAPLVEEITYRGAILGVLQTRMGFSASNLICGILFLLVHFPSWYFQGFFSLGAVDILSTMLSLLLLGWIFGFVAHRSKSVAASTLAHMLNNFFQRFVN